MIFVDGHVHIYDCFDVDLLFAAARDNFNRAAGQLGMSTESVTPVLLLTEGATDHWYGRLLETAKSIEQTVCNISADWDGCFSPEMDSLMVYRRDNPEEKLYLIAGRQIVTAQSIEVLALFAATQYKTGYPWKIPLQLFGNPGGFRSCPGGLANGWENAVGVLENFFSPMKRGCFFWAITVAVLNYGRPRPCLHRAWKRISRSCPEPIRCPCRMKPCVWAALVFTCRKTGCRKRHR